MIAPHELKNKSFTRAVRGYNPVEVDQYFDFLIEKYTEAYKMVSELEQKYSKIQAKYSELSNEEETIRSAILKAQKLGEVIVNNAKSDAKQKEAELKSRCDAIIAEAKEAVLKEKEQAAALRRSALEFQNKLYGDYVKHIQMIREMNLNEPFAVELSAKEFDRFLSARTECIGQDEVQSEPAPSDIPQSPTEE